MGGDLMFENALPYAFSRNAEPIYVPASMVREQYPGEQAYVPVRAVQEPVQEFYGVGPRGRGFVPVHAESWGRQMYPVPPRGGEEFVPLRAFPGEQAYGGVYPRTQAYAPAGGAFRQPAVEMVPVRDGGYAAMPRRQSYVPVYVPGEHGAGVYQPRIGYGAGHPVPVGLKPRYGGLGKDVDGFVPVAMEPRCGGLERGAGYGDGMLPVVLDPGYGGLEGGVAEPLEDVHHAWQKVPRQGLPVRSDRVYDVPVFRLGDNVKNMDADAVQSAAPSVRVIPVTGKVAEGSQAGKVDGTHGVKAEEKKEGLLKKGFLAPPASKSAATSGQKDGSGLLRKGFLVPSHRRRSSQESASASPDSVKETNHAGAHQQGGSKSMDSDKEGGPVSVPFDAFFKAVMDALKADSDGGKTASETTAQPKMEDQKVGSDGNGTQSDVKVEYQKTGLDTSSAQPAEKSGNSERSSAQPADESEKPDENSTGKDGAAFGEQSAVRNEESCDTLSTEESDALSDERVGENEDGGARRIRPCAKVDVMDEEVAARKIQAAFRGYSLRSTAPLEKARVIAQVRSEVRDMAAHLADHEVVVKLAMDAKEKLKMSEKLMQLLLRLDSIQGVHPIIRELRKAVARDLTGLQDMLESTVVEEPAVHEVEAQDSAVEASSCADAGSSFVTKDVEGSLVVNERQQEEATPDSETPVLPTSEVSTAVDVSHAGELDCGEEMLPEIGTTDMADSPVGESLEVLDRSVDGEGKNDTTLGAGALLEEVAVQGSQVVRQAQIGAFLESGELCENANLADNGVPTSPLRETLETTDTVHGGSEVPFSLVEADDAGKIEIAEERGVESEPDTAVAVNDEEGDVTSGGDLLVSNVAEGSRMDMVDTTEPSLEQLPVWEHSKGCNTSQGDNWFGEQPINREVDGDCVVDKVEDAVVQKDYIIDSPAMAETSSMDHMLEAPEAGISFSLEPEVSTSERPEVHDMLSSEASTARFQENPLPAGGLSECPGETAEVPVPSQAEASDSEERLLMRQLILENKKLETLVKKLLGVSELQTASIVDRLEKLEAKVLDPTFRDHRDGAPRRNSAARRVAGGSRRRK